MRLRLVFVALSVGIAHVVACGSSESTNNDVITPPAEAGPETSVPNDAAGDVSTPTSGPCAPAVAAECGNGRKCDAALGCIECAADGDCTAAGRDPFCILGRCEACRTNADCGVAAPVCYPSDHQCHRSCLGDAAVNCQGDAPLCDSATGACVGCNTSTDCPATSPICEPTTRSCVLCTKNTDCPAARPRCAIPRFECVECVTSAECGAGKTCNDNKCETRCTGDAQCGGDTPKCNVTTGRCVECLGAAECAAKPATPICDTDRGSCEQCVSKADCGDAGAPFCKDRVCVECRNDNDCPGLDPKCEKGQCQ